MSPFRYRPRHGWLASQPPYRIIAGSFLLCILLGTLLLTLPLASADGSFTPPLNALFTATSATCVTGLVTYDTAQHWSIAGQVIILLLIQVGGLGLITFTTFFSVAMHRRLDLRTIHLAGESTGGFGATNPLHLTRAVVRVSLAVELLGVFFLCTSFIPRYGAKGLWISVFLGVSAYCNAGFDILGFEGAFTSLSHYNGDPTVMLTISALIIIGGLGGIIFFDLFNYRSTKKLMLHTRVALLMTGLLLAFGFVSFLALEWRNPATLGALPVGQRFIAALFQSVTTRTAGFNSIDQAALSPISKLVSIGLMFIGASSGSTGGGIKVTTFAVLVMTVACVMRGRDDAVMWGRRVDQQVVYRALAIVVIAVLFVLVATCVILFTLPPEHEVSTIDALYEEVSAFATVGVTVGVTGVANLPVKIVLILSMFVGRVGPVSLALSLAAKAHAQGKGVIIPEGRIVVG